jgi:hypothetical protein
VNVITDAHGNVTGELEFILSPPLPMKLGLTVTGHISPARGGIPATFAARGKGIEGTPTKDAVYEIQGWFVPEAPKGDGTKQTIVRGSIMNTATDLGKSPAPLFSVGNFFLVPAATP